MDKPTFYQKYWKDLPPMAKGIIGISIVGISIIAGITIYRSFKKSKELREANKAAEAANKEISVLSGQGIKPSYLDSQYQVLSESLVQAMNGCGTDEEAIFNVFRKIKNDVDIRKLITAFGVRNYQPCAADQPISYTRWLFNDSAYGGALATFLNYDLDSDDIDEINNILKKNNVNYAF